ncbi:C39 family peptidase [Neobacillus ginsengisoli]|uniref:Glucan-binding YG repeat protein n=1 Tax=Neobacillus ginsengisoli TaxID=904295 RepID=A0ABT9XZ66_9BACI|nr:C39 family peptidase [Neobacillus ginsengisoli]MDQ0200875.1 glucan-binding YG repeat protein [Neobacillus ginsengisoli]
MGKFPVKVFIGLFVISNSLFPILASAEMTTGTNQVQGQSAEQTIQATAQQSPGTAVQPNLTPDLQLTEKVTDKTTVIKGKTAPSVKITVETNAGILNSVQANADGTFEVPISKQQANTILKITTTVGTNTYSIDVKVEASPPIGWVLVKGYWNYLNSNGQKMTGWVTDQGKRYFLDETGVMKTGWIKSSNRWYYLNTNGAMKTGWLYYGGKWYFLDRSGAMKTGWLFDGGKWYYLNGDGTMKIGWVQSGRDRYYLGSSGAIASVILDAPLIAQNPELSRGCEVTSLAMMLQDAGIKADKMELAKQLKKDPTPYSKQNGQIYFGNPNTGFVGDMYTFKHPGLAVYHGPIAELAKKYLPNRVVDFSGSNFEEIYKYLNNGTSVWVINNTWFDTVPSQYWQKWNTPVGPISITYKEHSVLVTGYDRNYIYFNDPLAVIKNRKMPVSAFKRGWEQMGKQAISYVR